MNPKRKLDFSFLMAFIPIGTVVVCAFAIASLTLQVTTQENVKTSTEVFSPKSPSVWSFHLEPHIPGSLPSRFYYSDYVLAEELRADSSIHIGNYTLREVAKMATAAESAGIGYYITSPHSKYCNHPEAECVWRAHERAFHIQRRDVEKFWKEYQRLFCP